MQISESSSPLVCSDASTDESLSPSAASQPRFPPEIYDNFIDESVDDSDLEDDSQHALSQYSLVCRAWLPRSRYWLFRDIFVADNDDALEFLQLLKNNPSIGQYVQCLTLCRDPPEFSHLIHAGRTTWSILVRHITSHLPNVTECELIEGKAASPRTLQHLSGIRTLRLTQLLILSSRALRGWLQSLPNLLELEIDIAEYGEEREQRIPKFSRPHEPRLPVVPHLARLKITEVPPAAAEKIIDLLMSNPSPLPIKELEIGPLSDHLMQNGWFKGIAPTLEHLRVSVASPRDPHITVSLFSLHLCAQLRHLDLEITDQEVQHAFSIESMLLSELESDNLKELTIRFRILGRFDRPSCAPHWQAFVDILRSSKFARLERLCFGFRNMVQSQDGRTGPVAVSISSEFETEIGSTFPDFASMGILHSLQKM